EEVGFWADHGLISAVLDPDFLENGYIYLLYNVDRHHLLYFGTEEYDAEIDDDFNGGMGRITRYTLNTESFTSVLPDSRHILLGDSRGTGIPIASQGHGAGALIFGEDGSLMVSSGDGNSHNCCYNGDGPLPGAGYDDISFQDGVLSETELLGAFRAQFIGGLNGKILRIDPETGEGISNNPFFVEGGSHLAQSKIWALGFRNPYRMVIRPGSGYGLMETGHPGTLFLSDVGETKWEEINIIRDGGGNYGWPIYEGPNLHELGYADLITSNPLAPNPLFDTLSCEQEFFSFQELILEENQTHSYFYDNGCEPGTSIPSSVQTFYHERPILAYPNDWGGPPEALLPAFDQNGNATTIPITQTDLENNSSFRGISGAGGVFLKGSSIPQEYQDTYILADFLGWLRAFTLTENNELTKIEHWSDSIGRPVNMALNPYDECVYITSLFPSFIKRICFGGNLKPIVSCTPDTTWGPSGMTVNFDASESYDPEGGSLEYQWDFGDGSTGEGVQTSHTYFSSGQHIESFKATITAKDTMGAEALANMLISLNNSPPLVEIISIDEGHLYSVQEPTLFELILDVKDEEEKTDELSFHWEHLLHHNNHFHLLDEYEFQNGNALVTPTGCSEEDNYWYEFKVTVTDRGGLSSSDSKMIYPDCDGKLMAVERSAYVLFPNPVMNELTIRSTKPLDEEIDYRIIDTMGKLIQEGSIQIYNEGLKFKVRTSSIQKGIYIMEYEDGGQRERIRFVKF
ncbi:MAG TPA: PQQ-dependent sugar dehydrogenase, partial [Cryomorphaceae bacterium]|nr:PQQ-dependent sugar dehydrogenase [Cryomorphaceae bacterium]